MRFIANKVTFDTHKIKTYDGRGTGVLKAVYHDNVVVNGTLDIFCNGNSLSADIVLNAEEQVELEKIIEKAADRFQKDIRSQVLTEIKQELR